MRIISTRKSQDVLIQWSLDRADNSHMYSTYPRETAPENEEESRRFKRQFSFVAIQNTCTYRTLLNPSHERMRQRANKVSIVHLQLQSVCFLAKPVEQKWSDRVDFTLILSLIYSFKCLWFSAVDSKSALTVAFMQRPGYWFHTFRVGPHVAFMQRPGYWFHTFRAGPHIAFMQRPGYWFHTFRVGPHVAFMQRPGYWFHTFRVGPRVAFMQRPGYWFHTTVESLYTACVDCYGLSWACMGIKKLIFKIKSSSCCKQTLWPRICEKVWPGDIFSQNYSTRWEIVNFCDPLVCPVIWWSFRTRWNFLCHQFPSAANLHSLIPIHPA